MARQVAAPVDVVVLLVALAGPRSDVKDGEPSMSRYGSRGGSRKKPTRPARDDLLPGLRAFLSGLRTGFL